MTVEETLRAIIARFNRHAEKTPAVRDELSGVERTIAIRITDGSAYAVDLKDGALGNLRAATATGRADVTITTDSATFEGLVSREIGPMKALVTRRLTLEGSLEDKLLFRRLL